MRNARTNLWDAPHPCGAKESFVIKGDGIKLLDFIIYYKVYLTIKEQIMTEKKDDEFTKLNIPNTEQCCFRQALKRVEKGEYEVEQTNDGKKVVIKKPGHKGKNDFRVDLYDPKDGTRESLEHLEIFNDIAKKHQNDPEETKKIIKGLLDVCNGKEPDNVIKDRKIKNGIGIPVDTIFKTYKWIWGQEDCNYEYGAGRWLSMNSILEEYNIKNKE
jgi:hypothetical protein